MKGLSQKNVNSYINNYPEKQKQVNDHWSAGSSLPVGWVLDCVMLEHNKYQDKVIQQHIDLTARLDVV